MLQNFPAAFTFLLGIIIILLPSPISLKVPKIYKVKREFTSFKNLSKNYGDLYEN
jgi:hypothetical protein